MRQILPGSVLGVLGGGQLGRMFAGAAQRMGYRVVVFAPEDESPAGQVAWRSVRADYGDEEALVRFAKDVDAVTLEFENVPSAALEVLERHVPVRPGPQALHSTQNRGREKEFLERHGFPHVLTLRLSRPAELDEAIAKTGMPAILKSAGFGYDGKGQVMVRSGGDLPAALEQLARGPAVLERFVEFEREISVIVCRSEDGRAVCYPPIENRHRRQILDVSSSPADSAPRVARRAQELAADVTLALGLVGMAAVEFFELPDGELLVNEIAPRPHNSGHLTIEACPVDQFEQQVRALCNLPLGEARFHSAAAMANLLGDLWDLGEPDWHSLLSNEGISLHLYGKAQARPGRKMGHLTALADSAGMARARVERAREGLIRAA